MAYVDYRGVRLRKKRGIFQKYRKEIGGTLFCIGFLLLLIASGETNPGSSVLWNLGFGCTGMLFATLGLYMLNLLSFSTKEWQ